MGKGGTTETYDGASTQSGLAGAAGRAIDGISFLTFINGQGDIRGSRIG